MAMLLGRLVRPNLADLAKVPQCQPAPVRTTLSQPYFAHQVVAIVVLIIIGKLVVLLAEHFLDSS